MPEYSLAAGGIQHSPGNEPGRIARSVRVGYARGVDGPGSTQAMRIRLLPLVGALLAGVNLGAQEGGEVDFVRDVRPIFEKHCYECHGGDEDEGGLRLDHRAGAFEREDADPVIVPGKPEESLLYQRITLPPDDEDIMPAEGDPLTPEQVAVIRRWIEQGAPWPQDAAPAAPRRPLHDVIVVPEIDAATRARVQRAVEAIRARGGLALPVARDTEAIDVNLSLLGKRAGDDLVALLADLEHRLVWLNLSRTAITDASLDVVGRLRELRRLDLSRTAVTDEGVSRLAGLAKLEYLNLYGTSIGDPSLRQIEKLKSLRKLFVWRTAVTDEGVARLRRARPDLHVDRGDYVVLPPLPTPVNRKCPVSGKPVDPRFVSAFEGKLVGFCCNRCKTRFDADPSGLRAKVLAVLPKETAGEEPKKEPPKKEKDQKENASPPPAGGKTKRR